ncbi:ABC transporter permease [Phaeacidiphilus oryzae]|uniref:ABC transporter permease n=1 Tax=Phaeacidiphilus oryzae TaxID=348818 RepID=UPI00137731A4|nr:ABC transporter permease [Phaeacidiphilus oryzae]
MSLFAHDRSRITQLIAGSIGLPVLFGIFLGAPLLAREFESGTYRFAFTQGAGRTRWLVTKISLLSVFTVLTALGFTLTVIWWFAPLVPLDGRLSGSAVYEIYGVVFVARALFALALGICAGAVLRRVVPAIGVTLAIWTGLTIATTAWFRAHLMPPLHVTDADAPSGAWALSQSWTDAAGRAVGRARIAELQYQAAQRGHKFDTTAYLAREGYHHSVSYQPGSRFWDFQLIEGGGLVLLSLLLLAAAVLLVRRRAA